MPPISSICNVLYNQEYVISIQVIKKNIAHKQNLSTLAGKKINQDHITLSEPAMFRSLWSGWAGRPWGGRTPGPSGRLYPCAGLPSRHLQQVSITANMRAKLEIEDNLTKDEQLYGCRDGTWGLTRVIARVPRLGAAWPEVTLIKLGVDKLSEFQIWRQTLF